MLRLSQDGLTPISATGMKDWFGDNLKIGLPFSEEDLKDLIEFGNIEWDKYEGAKAESVNEDEVYRLHLTFKGDEIALVKEKLSDNPEQTILDLIKD